MMLRNQSGPTFAGHGRVDSIQCGRRAPRVCVRNEFVRRSNETRSIDRIQTSGLFNGDELGAGHESGTYDFHARLAVSSNTVHRSLVLCFNERSGQGLIRI